MVLTLALLLAAHGLIHLLGFARAFEVADMPQLQPISRFLGGLWLAAGCLFLFAATALVGMIESEAAPPPALVLPVELVVRRSCGANNGGTLTRSGRP